MMIITYYFVFLSSILSFATNINSDLFKPETEEAILPAVFKIRCLIVFVNKEGCSFLKSKNSS